MPPTKSQPPAAPPVILDNHQKATQIGEYLRTQLQGDVQTLRIVSAYFTIYAYEALQKELEQPDDIRFLFGNPASVGELDPGTQVKKAFDLTEQGLKPSQVLRQKHLAKICEQWIRDRVQIRTIKKSNFLHGKMYHITRQQSPEAAVVGSSNFTYRGLGFGRNPNLELNLPIADAATRTALQNWFDALWHDEELTEDVKGKVIEALRRVGKDYSPEEVYFKTLLEIFRERMEAREEAENQVVATHLKDTKIWKTLYKFQSDGVTGIINRLEQHKGCILADSVGLGKTYTALAVIRYYEAKNSRVLVLCPKKLSENWKLYPAQFNQMGNPFKEDNFHYTVLHHTDLSRKDGESNGIDLAKFDWDAYGLVVIDESHHFRNDSKSAIDDDGKIIRRSRYDRLLQEVIRAGGETRVLMLSATPVNTSLIDLRNQIYFMTGGQDDAFRDTLGIGNIRTMINAAQKQFKQWEEQETDKDKRDLFNKLGGEFFTLLDATSIARSRQHVKKFYPEVVKEIGGFPTQIAPENKQPPTDTQGSLSYQSLNEEIGNFRLSVYTPAAYAVSEEIKRELEKEKKDLNFNQADREHWLIGMIRVNFLKRLESAAPSLESTLGRTIGKIDKLITRIGNYQAGTTTDGEALETPDAEPDDDDFIVNKARNPLHFRDLDLSRWLSDLQNDRTVLEGVRQRIAKITPKRDGKLLELKEQIQEKLQNPTTDKNGRKNRKVLVFTAFRDTAEYLYRELRPMIEGLHANCAMVAGDVTQTNCGANKFNDILTNFAPIGRDRSGQMEMDGQDIDVLIATDCVSEGQNLQDCDLVVNYDIHWNPVRLIQRFGRIDRIGSPNQQVRMVNYWPTTQLDDYLKLKNRVEARMVLVDAAATGDELLTGETEGAIQGELDFRDEQLRRLRNEVLDLDDLNDGVALSDFSLDDFLAQLMAYLEANRQKLEDMPSGAYAIAGCARQQQTVLRDVAAPGVIFCLRHKNPPQDRQVRSPLKAYYLVYIRTNGEVRYNYTHAKQVLELFGGLAHGESGPLQDLCAAFDCETDKGRNMEKYNKLLKSVFSAIASRFTAQEAEGLKSADGILPVQSEQPQSAGDFELVTWLVIK